MSLSKKGASPLKRLKDQLQAVDLLFEVRDARLPKSSIHPKTKEFFGNKPRVIVFCKEDLADPDMVRRWTKHYSGPNQRAIALSLKMNKGKDLLLSLATELCKDKIASREKKGLLPRPVRVAVVGLPNVGKSSLINWMIGKKKAAVANTPGVTRGNSWIRIHPLVEMLDTPGMLPMAMFRGEQAMKLALCNILPGDHYDVEEIALFGLKEMAELYPRSLEVYTGEAPPAELLADGDELADATFVAAAELALPEEIALSAEIEEPEFGNISDYDKDDEELGLLSLASMAELEMVAKARGCLKSGGVLDLKRAAGIFVSDFRSGKLGRVVLDKLPEGNFELS